MRTSISFNLPVHKAKKVRTLARARGFQTTSEYLRFLISQDDVALISEDELVKRSNEVDQLYKVNKLLRAKSLAEFLR